MLVMKMAVLWDVAPRDRAQVYQRSEVLSASIIRAMLVLYIFLFLSLVPKTHKTPSLKQRNVIVRLSC